LGSPGFSRGMTSPAWSPGGASGGARSGVRPQRPPPPASAAKSTRAEQGGLYGVGMRRGGTGGTAQGQRGRGRPDPRHSAAAARVSGEHRRRVRHAPGGVGALLRREALSTAQGTDWRRPRAAGGWSQETRAQGPATAGLDLEGENRCLRHELERPAWRIELQADARGSRGSSPGAPGRGRGVSCGAGPPKCQPPPRRLDRPACCGAGGEAGTGPGACPHP